VLEPRRALGVEERAGDGDHLAREEALLELPLDAADAQRSVAADATACAERQRVVELALGRGAWLRSLALEGLERALAHEAAVRRAVVVAVEPREQAHLHVVERAVLAEVIEALLAQRAPEALHLAARLGVVGRRVPEADLEPAAHRREGVTDVRRAVVEVERAGATEATDRLDAERDHLRLALGVRGAQRDDVAARVVEDGVDAQRDLALADVQRGTVADVRVPQRHRVRGLPSPSLTTFVHAGGQARHAVLLVETAHRRGRDGALLEA